MKAKSNDDYWATLLCSTCRKTVDDYRHVRRPASFVIVTIPAFSVAEAAERSDCCWLCCLMVDCVRKSGYYDEMCNMAPSSSSSSYVTVDIEVFRAGWTEDTQAPVHFHRPGDSSAGGSGELLFRSSISPRAFKGMSDLYKRRLVSDTIDASLVKCWLRECSSSDSHHGHLPVKAAQRRRIESLLPKGLFRMINVVTGEVVALSSIEPFVALSYVWGTQKGDDKKPSEVRGTSAYPPTIRDAADIAASLGIPWLWVDRICITQDDEDEKAHLVPYIRDIYSTADLTVVAACGSGAHSGLSGAPRTPRTAESLPEIFSHGGCIVDLPEFPDLIRKSTWQSRAWTFQEHVFSRRILWIFPDECMFSCSRGGFRESRHGFDDRFAVDENHASPFNASDLSALFQQSSDKGRKEEEEGDASRNLEALLTTKKFTDVIKEYTSRELSFEEDRVAAFAGVLMAAARPSEIVAEQSLLRHGHLMRCFGVLLTWKRVYTYDDDHNPPHQRHRLRQASNGRPFAPSWSWASAGGPVTYQGSLYGSPSDRGWLHYKLLRNNYDIMGVPVQDAIRKSAIGLPYPHELIDEQPWERDVDPHMASELEVSARYPGSASPISLPRRLPVLHLVTLTFDAYFVFAKRKADCELLKSHYHHQHHQRLQQHRDQNRQARTAPPPAFGGGAWYLTMPDSATHGISASTRHPAASRSFYTFAVVRGNDLARSNGLVLDIALLKKVGRAGEEADDEEEEDDDDNTFTRVYVFNVQWRSDETPGRLLSVAYMVIKESSPRWRHIRVL